MSQILQNHYVLAVHNARRSAAFYVEMLGFRIVNEPPGWVFVAKDNCMIMLGGATRTGQSSRAELLSEIEDKPWGMREFGLRTPDGHQSKIGCWLI